MTTRPGPRVCFFGDSFTAGTGDDDCLGWVGRLGAAARRRGCDLTVYNLGVRGDTSQDIRRRWRHEAEARLPASRPELDGRLVFCFGVNDCTRDEAGRPRVPEADSLVSARAILSEASAWRPTLMIGGLGVSDAPDAAAALAALTAGYARLCADLGVPYHDASALSGPGSLWRREAAAGDGAHPGAGGHAALAAALAAWPPWQAWIGGG